VDGTVPSSPGFAVRVVNADGVAVVGHELAHDVVERNRPEAVARDVGRHGQLVLADRQARVHVDIAGLLVEKPAPSSCMATR